MGIRDDKYIADEDRVQRMKVELNQKRVPSDPNRDTSGDSVYVPEPRTEDPVGPDSPVTINGFQTVQVMPLSQYDADKDLLIVNVMVGKMRPDRAKEYLERIRKEIELCVKPTGWKHIMFVPITYDHPLHRQFRTVQIGTQKDIATNSLQGMRGYQPITDDLDDDDPPRET